MMPWMTYDVPGSLQSDPTQVDRDAAIGPRRNVAVVGAGAMGLCAAYYAAKAGHRVTVFEHDRVPGGMAAHFDFDGFSIERFYHFVCKAVLIWTSNTPRHTYYSSRGR